MPGHVNGKATHRGRYYNRQPIGRDWCTFGKRCANTKGLRCPARLDGMMGFEAGRTALNLIELVRGGKVAKTL